MEKGAGGDPQRSCHRAKGHGEEMHFPLRTTKSRVFYKHRTEVVDSGLSKSKLGSARKAA